jgi:mRNA interferase RelE/StbE
MYEIYFRKSAVKELKKIPVKDQTLITAAIKALASNPHPQGHKKLIGDNSTFRIRIGNYRVIYDLYETRLYIEVIRVRHRKDAYR